MAAGSGVAIGDVYRGGRVISEMVRTNNLVRIMIIVRTLVLRWELSGRLWIR